MNGSKEQEAKLRLFLKKFGYEKQWGIGLIWEKQSYGKDFTLKKV